MNWWGKLIGGGLGFMMGGPLGAIMGAAFGHQFDRGIQHLDQDIPKLEALIGCKLGAFPHDNRSDHENYKDVYSAADRDLMAEVAAPDIVRFHYRF